ncbi:UNVERIFIED_CONTAM: hypothetical protein NCL1_48104 [Trichonephila clavipes]
MLILATTSWSVATGSFTRGVAGKQLELIHKDIIPNLLAYLLWVTSIKLSQVLLCSML